MSENEKGSDLTIVDKQTQKKFLTVCEGGNVRSVGLAFILKNFGQDAVAIGWRFAGADVQNRLMDWADYIVIMQQQFAKYVPEIYHPKIRVVDVGEDRFGTPYHPELQSFLHRVVENWNSKNFNI